MKQDEFGYPTLEEFLDVEFWSIVRDCRAIYAGTLTPRTWADISSTWLDDEEPRNTQMHRSAETRAKMSLSRRMSHATRILIANGTNKKDARAIATKLLRKEK